MATSDLNRTFYCERWQWRPIIGLHFAALLLFLSWLWPVTRQVWDVIDQTFFFLLNGTIDERSSWSFFWAAANTRIADFITGILLLALIFLPQGVFPWGRKLTGLIGIVVLVVVVIHITGEASFLLIDHNGWRVQSPSLVLEPVNSLVRLFPEWTIKIKESSGNSFPSDHAIVLFVLAGFVIQFAKHRKTAFFVVILFPLFLLPRMVAGAHWLTDNAIGGGCVALVTLAWVCYTPLLAWIENWFQKIRSRLFG